MNKQDEISFESNNIFPNYKNDDDETLKSNVLPFFPKIPLSNDTLSLKDSLINEKYDFYDKSLSFERDETSIFIHCNYLNIPNIETLDKISLTSKNDFNLTNNFITYKKNRNKKNKLFFVKKNNYFNSRDFDSKANHTIVPIDSINFNEIKNKEEKPANSCNRCDSLLIKFKSVLGKWFVNNLNTKIKSILKRRIKFYSFNYKKFTIIVSYSKNRMWLDEKIKDLLVLGEEPNQDKNKKSLNSLFRKKFEKLNEIKSTLELTYRQIIELFYLSEDFKIFKNDKRVIELDDNFNRVMNISILDSLGFIKFLENRKGNTRKK